MSLNDIKKPEIKIKINGKEWNVRFTIRNFAALKEKYDISENDILQGLINGDIRKIPYAIWCATLKFDYSDPANPFKIKEEIPLDDLFELELGHLKEITDEVIKAMEAFLPKQPEGGAPKKPRKKAKKSLK